MAPRNQQPLIVIVGPTASGKSALALKLAKEYDGEIICADSRTIYKGMDIGTAKPTKEDRKLVKHHLLDVVYPNESFTAADFQQLAKKAITDIRRRGKVPFLVGGTGLYIDSVVFDYKFNTQAEANLRKKLTRLTLEQLWRYCKEINIELPENKYNKRYVVRAIEQKGINKQRRKQPIENCFIVGISTNKAELRTRIARRADMIFASGVISEAAELVSRYGLKQEAMTANIYKLAHKVNNKELSQEEARQKFITLDRRLAKRQLTWLKRNPYIQWHAVSEAYEQISLLLDSRQKTSKRATM